MQGFALSLLCRSPMTVSFCPVPSPVGLVVKKRVKELFFAILHCCLRTRCRRVRVSLTLSSLCFAIPDHKPNVVEFRVEGFLTLILVILLNQGSAGTE
jgi:hypothetical protein